MFSFNHGLRDLHTKQIRTIGYKLVWNVLSYVGTLTICSSACCIQFVEIASEDKDRIKIVIQ